MTERKIISPSVAPEVVNYAPAKTGLGQAQRILAEKAQVEGVLGADPTLNPDGRKAKLSVWASRNMESGRGALGHSEEVILRRDATLTTEVAQSRKTPPGPKASEIRAVLRAMDPATRRATINRAVEERDAATIGSILEGPAWLSGESPAMLKAISAQWTRTHFPDHARELESLAQDLTRVQLARTAFEKIMDEAERPGREALARAEASRRALS